MGLAHNVLLVEDNPGDVELVREGFRQSPTPPKLAVAGDGVSALSYLRNPRTPTPDLILLDINLPLRGGHEILAELKQDPALSAIPVLVLTSSERDEDVLRAYSNSANAYLSKPGSATEFLALVALLESFWLSVARLPSRAQNCLR